MNVQPKDAGAALTPALLGAPSARSAGGAAWQRHWALAHHPGGAFHAEGDAGTGTLPPARSGPASERKELEGCGIPGAGAPMFAAPTAVSAGDPPAGANADAVPPRDPVRAEGEAAPVRVHVERSGGDGLRVWLGIDAAAQGLPQLAGAALAELHQVLHATGQRLDALVCNGSLLYQAAAQPAVRRWPAPAPNHDKETP